jgi:hypothetical protein
MDVLTSPTGSLAIAISALLLVMGFRLARPVRTREWLAIAAYAGALVALTLGALGLLEGPAAAPGLALRLAGLGVLVAGLLLAGSAARARTRAAAHAHAGAAAGAGAPQPTAIDPVYAGLALILVGQLLRGGPSRAGAVSVGVAVLLACWAALTPQARTQPR